MARTKQTPRCSFTSLMSPPEPAPLDKCRATGTATGETTDGKAPKQPISALISPPIEVDDTIGPTPSEALGGKDPILYPGGVAPANAPSGPLFSSAIPASAGALDSAAEEEVSKHIASRPAYLFRGMTPPRREDYELALHFKSTCWQQFQENPTQWLRQERELLRADRKHTALPTRPRTALPSRPLTRLPPILPASKPAVLGPQEPPRLPTLRIHKPKTEKAKAAAESRPIRVTPAASSKKTPAASFKKASATSFKKARVKREPRARSVVPKKIDKDFSALEDLSPPANTLDSKGFNHKVDFKCNPLDLSNDPDRDRLHPEELWLASSLRFTCAQYLTCKRRIFIRRLECIKLPKEFRKTDAQSACKVDVNKASKLWEMFEHVGWLDVKWMSKYL